MSAPDAPVPTLAVAAEAIVEAPGAAPSQLRELFKGLRLHQWVKNLLVFVPIVLAGQFGNLSALSSTAVAFLAFGLIASATYLVNDMRDLAADRAHGVKRHRPLASGRLSMGVAAFTATLLIVAGLSIGALASMAVAGFLMLYLLLTIAYSLGMKRVPLLDGLVLAALFTIRLAVGIVAAEVRPSAWLLVFSMFMFTSLTYAKRHAEIMYSAEQGQSAVAGRGYRTADAPLVLAVGVAAGVGAILIVVLYIIEEAFTQTFYGNKIALWGMPLLLFLMIGRIWLKCQRNELSEDVAQFVLGDRPSLALVALTLVCFSFAWLGPN